MISVDVNSSEHYSATCVNVISELYIYICVCIINPQNISKQFTQLVTCVIMLHVYYFCYHDDVQEKPVPTPSINQLSLSNISDVEVMREPYLTGGVRYSVYGRLRLDVLYMEK